MRVGFTTTLPVEIIIAAGHTPVDLNNLFITGDSTKYIDMAEHAGFPRNTCSWIKGLYSVALEENLDVFIPVTEGDCSNTKSLTETLIDQGLKTISFAFPHRRSYNDLKTEIDRFRSEFSVSEAKVNETKQYLDSIRTKLIELDRLTYSGFKATGLENHLWLVNSSDFGGDPEKYEKDLDGFLNEVRCRPSRKPEIVLGYIGVPPIFKDLYDFLDEQNYAVVFNEIQRQFSMPFLEKDIVEQYLRYSYPYGIEERIKEINSESKIRNIQAILSYSQAFCHRQIDNILFKKYLNKPLIIIEGDQPSSLDERTKLRLESFFEILAQ